MDLRKRMEEVKGRKVETTKEEDIYKNTVFEYFEPYQIRMPQAIVREVLLYPDVAKTLLDEFNFDNRKVSASHVKTLIKAIKDERFKLNYIPIIFDKNNEVGDGGHRLAAIAECGRPVWVFMVWGVDPELATTYDLGRRRNLGQLLATKKFNGQGFKNANHVAQIVRYIYRYNNGTMKSASGNDSVSMEEGLMIAIEEEDAIQNSIKHGAKAARVIGATPGVLGFCHYIFSKNDPESADDFLEKMASGLGLEGKRDPVFQIRSRYLDRLKKSNNKDVIDLIAITIKAWNHYRRGEYITQLMYRPGGKRKESFPEAI